MTKTPLVVKIPEGTRADLDSLAETLGQEISIIARAALYDFLDQVRAHKQDLTFYADMARKLQAARGRDYELAA